MINFLHRYTGALSKCLFSLICAILLVGQIFYQPCSSRWLAATPATLAKQPGRDTGNTPDAHCHRKVYLLVDKRYDLKPVLFLPVPLFRLAVVSIGHVAPADGFSPRLAAGTVRQACLRGPPSI